LRLSTLALDGSEGNPTGAGAPVGDAEAVGQSTLLRYADLVLLALAAPIFVLADLPLLGYGVAAAAWLAQHGILAFAERRSTAALRAGNRRAALGSIAVATLGRVWLVTLAILLVGLLAEREDGLAAAVLCAVLVTVHLGGMALSRLFAPEAG
jgi:hypothetical protein